ncbi:hypothetical protein [Campylobacter concisus]|uniref:Uncharacterized protein n=1 Tax=Campylobacter concisus TaxID=199 RepID=A0AAE7TNI9_9BACT|nr:hypothetical protein [Campylobacter concisus]QPH85643.1 hypothetical protein CVT17_00995 [Campylobacter concisus]
MIADKFLKFETNCLFVKVAVVNLWQASELNLCKKPMGRRLSCRVFAKI